MMIEGKTARVAFLWFANHTVRLKCRLLQLQQPFPLGHSLRPTLLLLLRRSFFVVLSDFSSSPLSRLLHVPHRGLPVLARLLLLSRLLLLARLLLLDRLCYLS